MIESIKKKIRNQIKLESKSSIQYMSDDYVVELMSKAETLDCPEAVDNCIKHLTGKSKFYSEMKVSASNLSSESSSKLTGFIIKNQSNVIRKMTDYIQFRNVPAHERTTMNIEYLLRMYNDMQRVAEDLISGKI